MRPRALWAAVALSVVGCALVVDAPAGTGNLDGLGVLAAVAAVVTLAIYLTASERAGQRYDAFTTLAYGFGFATLFWLRRAAGLDVPLGAAGLRPQRRRWRWAWP